MTQDEIMQALAAPFAAKDVEWRVQNTNKEHTRGMAVPYIDSRAIQNRLDSVVGIYNWKPEYRPWHQVEKVDKDRQQKGAPNASQLCGLSIYCTERQEWIQKWDAAENSDIEPVKGGISDSFKRAAVLWNVGRYLYDLEPVWVDVELRGRSYAIKPSEYTRLNREYEAAVKKMFGSVPASPPKEDAAGRVVPSVPPAPGNTEVTFDYAVKSAQIKTFASGKGMVVVLHDPKKARNFTAYLYGEHPELAEGVCLRQVRLSRHDGPNPFNTLDSFQVAA